MNKMKTNVPEIRFQGFEGEWEKAAYKDLFSKLSNNSLSRAELNYSSGSAKNVHYGDVLIKLFEILDIENEQLPYINNPDIVTKYISSKLQDGDVIIADAAEDETVGKCTELVNVKNETILAGLHTIAIRPEITFASLYLGYYLNTDQYHNQLLRLMQGTKVSSISNTALQDTNISFPSDKFEQSKIGSYFKNLDKLITLKQRKLDKQKNVKKSMLGKMFPREGATVPEIRFQGFSGEWEKKTLGEDVARIIGGGTPSTSNSEYWNGNIDWYSPTEIGDKIFADGSEKKITQLGLEKSAACILPPKKTILFTSRAGIGDMAILRNEGTTNQGFQSLVLNAQFDTYFIYSMGFLIKKFAEKFSSGSTFLEISGKKLGKMQLFAPSLPEQTKIGTYFKNLDHLISLQQEEIEKLKQIKSACLGKMFV